MMMLMYPTRARAAARGRGDPTKTSDPFDPFLFSFLLAALNGKFPAVAIGIVEP